jgi:aminopeptidase YwaD
MKNRSFFLVVILMTVFIKMNGQDPNLINSLARHVEILASDSLSGRGCRTPEKQMSVDYITGEFIKAGFAPLDGSYIHTFILGGEIEGKNIAGLIEGSDPGLKNEYIVIGAHYDHLGWKMKDSVKVVYNGADDNASGVATIIEVGKQLMALKSELKRSVIIIAFDGEESGLLGSTAFANDTIIDISKVKVMFSFDMVGMYSTNHGINMYGLKSIQGGENFIAEAVTGESVKIKGTKNIIENRTDTWSFGVKNIPAVYVSTGLDSPYHKPEDDSDLLDYQGMAEVVNAMTAVVKILAERDDVETDKRFIARAINPNSWVGLSITAGSSHFEFDDQFYRGKSMLAISTGLVSQFKLSKYFMLQPLVTCDMAGSQTEEGKLSLFSVSPQVNILLTTPTTRLNGPISYIYAGAFYRYNFAGITGFSSYDFEDKYCRNDSGINIGFGMQFMKIQVNYFMKYGLHKINLTETNGSIYSRSSGISITKFF